LIQAHKWKLIPDQELRGSWYRTVRTSGRGWVENSRMLTSWRSFQTDV